MKENYDADEIFGPVLFWLAIFGVLYYMSTTNFLIFHVSAEFFSVIIAGVIFVITWNIREQLENNFYILVGQAYLFVAIIDFFHTLAYKGMDLLTTGANLATELWIAGRYFESFALLAGAFLLQWKSTLSHKTVFYVLVVLFILLMATIYPLDVFPRCFDPATGLTVFKKASEFLICFVLLGAWYFLGLYKNRFSRVVFNFTRLSIIFTIFAELAFTFCVSVYGLSNIIGHFFKILSFYCIYRGIIITGFKSPLDSLLRELREHEEKLAAALEEKETLLSEIHHRVKNNLNVVSSMLFLQAREVKNKAVRAKLESSRQRIKSIGQLHEQLYKSGNMGQVNFEGYLNKLVDELISTYSQRPGKVDFQLAVDIDSEVDFSREIYVGLIVTELVTNSLKYATDPETGELELHLGLSLEANQYRLEVSDNGQGLPEDVEIEEADSLGLRLVTILAEDQLNGALDYTTTAEGTTFVITFPQQ